MGICLLPRLSLPVDRHPSVPSPARPRGAPSGRVGAGDSPNTKQSISQAHEEGKEEETRSPGPRRTSSDMLGAPREELHPRRVHPWEEREGRGESQLLWLLYTYRESSDLTLTSSFRPEKKGGGGQWECEKTGKVNFWVLMEEGTGSQSHGVPVKKGAEPMSLLDSGSTYSTPSCKGLPCDLNSAISHPRVKVGPDPPLLSLL